MTEEQEQPQTDQTFWSIKSKDKPWFLIMTTMAGTALAVTTVATAIVAPDPEKSITTILAEATTGIASAYIAAGFGDWSILNAKNALIKIRARHPRKKAKRAKTQKSDHNKTVDPPGQGPCRDKNEL